MTRVPSFADYLLAKRSVDDRALSAPVYRQLAHALAERTGLTLRVLEIGCGVGTMVERLEAWGLFAEHAGSVSYTAIDSDAETIAMARARIRARPGLELRFDTAELDAFAAATADRFDLIIANAVLDLLDLDRTLPTLRRLLAPGGLGWFTINFDGITHFEPPVDPALDGAIERAYHATMDIRAVDGAASGGSCTGRRLFTELPRHGLPILAAGASDWVVHPVEGRYAQQEALFLRAIVEMMRSALTNDPALDAQALAAWLDTRRAQIDAAQLTYLAHQLDFLVRLPASSEPSRLRTP